MKTKLVSIILPTYNRPKKIIKTINSILNQTYINWELIVVNDGSNLSYEYVYDMYKLENRIHFFYYKKNRGPSYARNFGIEHSNGDYIAFIDDDDIWKKEKLKKQINIFNEKDIGIVYCATQKIKDNEHYIIPYKCNKKLNGDIFVALLDENFIAMPSIIYNRKKIRTVKLFDINLHLKEDWDFLIKIAQKHKFYYIPEVLVISYYSENSVNSFDYEKEAKVYEYIFKKYYNYIKQYKDIHCKKKIYIANLFFLSGNYRKFKYYIRNCNLCIKNIFKIFILIFFYITDKSKYKEFYKFSKYIKNKKYKDF